MKKSEITGLLLFWVVVLIGSFSYSQTPESTLEAFTDALKRPSPAATVGCTDDQIRFKNIGMKDGILHFLLETGSTGNMTEETYKIDLQALSIEEYGYTDQRCIAELTLYSKEGERAFHFREFDYLANRLEEHREGTRSDITFRINKDPDRRIVKTLFELAKQIEKH